MSVENKLNNIKLLLEKKNIAENKFMSKYDKLKEEVYLKKKSTELLQYINMKNYSLNKINDLLYGIGLSKITKISTDVLNLEKCKVAREILINDDYDLELFFELFGIQYNKNISIEINKDILHDFIDQVEYIINELTVSRKNSYLNKNVDEIYINKYLKYVHDEYRIKIFNKIINNTYYKIHSIWEITNDTPTLSEESYLLAHCTKSYLSCWPIIKEGLKLSKSNGGTFGRGIYFSNDVQKCLQYASFCIINNNRYTLFFFVQVYTGIIKELKYPNSALSTSDEYDTILGVGMSGPKKIAHIMHSDSSVSKIYVDEPSYICNDSPFSRNEFVIYNENRCKLRYCVLVHGSNKII